MREWEEASLTDLVLLPLLPYLAWALVYYAKARARPLPARPRTNSPRCDPYRV
jgi:hypothetical protein